MTSGDYRGMAGADCWNPDHVWREVRRFCGYEPEGIEFDTRTGLYVDVHVPGFDRVLVVTRSGAHFGRYTYRDLEESMRLLDEQIMAMASEAGVQ